ncbi:hypothetical protein [Roseibium suaedae]|uniref:NlpC/P60 domain-containing protein n=1 Tax=Roseibium suaedae TaxID=735517 RepID=A0A1M7PS63_9HYPH|nr:hypothetical protein [Roseibium suaedae]SHN20219.1 hypothetical protein SAMN05444272_4609 [Roseibium suaedae]
MPDRLSAWQLEAFSRLIGAPYDPENRAPGFHCWGAFCAAQEILGRAGFPEFVPDSMTNRARIAALTGHPERGRWREIAAPEHGCAVLMGRSSLPIHIGCWLAIDGGGVLHAVPGPGVVFETLSRLRLASWRCITFHLPV